MAGEIGTAYVSVMPSTKGFTKALTSQGGVAGTRSGKRFASTFGGSISKGAAAIGGAVGGVVSSVTTTAMSAISGSMDRAISRVDTLNNFSNVMGNMGISGKKAKAVIDDLAKTKLNDLPTTLDDAASSIQRFTSKNNDIKKSEKYFLGINNALLAGGAPMDQQASALEQLSQSYAKGRMDMMEWRTVQSAMPAQMKQVAMSMGMSTEKLGEGLRNGKISMDKFMEEVSKLNEKGTGKFKSFAAQAKGAVGGIGTSMANFRTSITKNVAKVVDYFAPQISGAFKAGAKKISEFGDGVIAFIDGVNNTLDTSGIGTAAQGVMDSFMSAFPSDGGDIKSFGEMAGEALNGVKGVLEDFQPYAQAAGEGIKWVADNSDQLLPLAIGLGGAFVAWKVVSAVAGPLQTIGGAISGIASKAFGAAAGTTALAAAEGAEGAAAAGSVGQTLAMGAAILMIGGGVALAALGVGLLAQSAIALAGAGGAAVPVMVGLGVGMVAMMAACALLGPGLNIAAVGMLAFGGAVLMVGAGIMLACAGMALLSMQLPVLCAFAPMAAPAIMVLGAAALAASPGLLALGAAGIVVGAGLVAAGAGAILLGGGLLICGAASVVLGAGLAIVSVFAPAVAATLPVLAAGALAAAPALLALAAPVAAIAIPLGVFSVAMIGAAAGMVAFGTGAMAGAVGVAWMLQTLPLLPPVANAASDGMKALGDGMTQAAPVISTASEAMASGLSALEPASGFIGVLAVSMASLVATSAMLAASGQGISASWNSGMSGFCSSVKKSLAQARADIALFIASTTAQIASWHPRMGRIDVTGSRPVFSMSGKFDPKTKSVPVVSVSGWYADGSVFGKPTVIGVGEGRYKEAVVPLSPRVLAGIGEGISENSDQRGGMTVVFNIEGDARRDELDECVRNIDRLWRKG